jgi:hypothetical protein
MDFFDLCLIAAPSTNDGYEDSYGTPEEVSCHIEEIVEKNSQLSNKTTSVWVGFPPETEITEDYQVTIDGKVNDIMVFKIVKSPSSGQVEYYRAVLGDPSYGGKT